MREAGRAEVERAKADGRWEGAYADFRSMAVPEVLETALDGVEGARGKWDGLTKTERYLFCLRVGNLRTEKGRERAVRQIVSGLMDGGEGEEVGKRKRKRGEEEVDEGEVSGDGGVEPELVVAHESRADRAARRSRR